jgi:hypothetical protein
MLNLSKKNNAVYILYASKNYTSSVTVTANVYDDTNTLYGSSPYTLLEISTTGMYGITFTPTTTGNFKVEVLESTTKMASASIKITDNDIESVAGDVTSVLSLLNNAVYGLQSTQSGVASIQSDTMDIKGVSFTTGSDSLHQIKDYLVNTIQSSISQIQNNTLTSVSLPTQMLISTTPGVPQPYNFYVNTMDEQGMMTDPYDQDSGAGTAMVSVAVLNQAGTSRNSKLSGLDSSTQGGLNWMTRMSTGRFSGIYSVASGDALEELNFTFKYKHAVAENDRIIDRSSVVTLELNVNTQVNAIKADVENSTFGLSAIKTLIDYYDATTQADLTTIEGKIDTVTTNVGTVNTTVNGINTLLTNVTYGLSALKTLIDNANTAIANMRSSIEGAGFNTATDSLAQISSKVSQVYNRTGGYIA